MERVPCLFVLEPIGVNGTLEAVDILRFCSDECLSIIKTNTAHTVSEGQDKDYLPGTVCDECGVTL